MPTILFVDDHADLRAAVGRDLRGAGFELFEAGDGAEALELLRGMTVDLVLLDLSMPVLDGISALRQLRERGDQTPVILVTSESSRRLVVEALRLGISDYVFKPFSTSTLLVQIASALAPPVEG